MNKLFLTSLILMSVSFNSFATGFRTKLTCQGSGGTMAVVGGLAYDCHSLKTGKKYTATGVE